MISTLRRRAVIRKRVPAKEQPRTRLSVALLVGVETLWDTPGMDAGFEKERGFYPKDQAISGTE